MPVEELMSEKDDCFSIGAFAFAVALDARLLFSLPQHPGSRVDHQGTFDIILPHQSMQRGREPVVAHGGGYWEPQGIGNKRWRRSGGEWKKMEMEMEMVIVDGIPTTPPNIKAKSPLPWTGKMSKLALDFARHENLEDFL